MKKFYEKFKSYTTAQQAIFLIGLPAGILILLILLGGAINQALNGSKQKYKHEAIDGIEWQSSFEVAARQQFANSIKNVALDYDEIKVTIVSPIAGISESPFADACTVIKEYQAYYKRNTTKSTIKGYIYQDGSLRSKFICDDNGLKSVSR